MNLPNKLTILRMIMVPFFMFFIMLPEICAASTLLCDIVALVIFALASLTDMLDGKIARKRGIVTDFGKFMDPIADKIMTFGAFIAILACERFSSFKILLAWAVTIVLLREFAVTSVRLVAQNRGNVVIAANYLGKVKTVSQIVCIIIIFLEGNVFAAGSFFETSRPLSVASIAVMLVFTVLSGANYIKDGVKYFNK